MQWDREKMRVRLTQTLSKSVSDALIFLSGNLKDDDFKGAVPTADFSFFQNLIIFLIFSIHGLE